MNSIKGRLRRAEAAVVGGRCPGCKLRPQDKGHIVVEDKKGTRDPVPGLPEVCPECGRHTRIRIVVVEDPDPSPETDEEGEDGEGASVGWPM